MSEAMAFYCGKLGFEPVMEVEIPSGIDMMSEALGVPDSGYKVAMLKKGNSCIELFEFSAPDTPRGDPLRRPNQHGITHICLVASDYEADYAALESAGVVFNTPPVGGSPTRWAYGRDPFGNVLELLEHDPSSPSALNYGI